MKWANIGAASGYREAACPSNVGPKGRWSRWRDLEKTLPDSNKTGLLRRIGPVIEISVEALTKRKGKKNGRQKPEMVSKELDAQSRAVNSTRASRQSVRILRRMKEREARVIVRDERLVKSLLARQLNPIEDVNASRMTTTFSTLHSWPQRGRACAEDEDEVKNTQEKSLESREDSRFTGVVVGDKNGKIKRKIERVEEDGIFLVVPARINGKMFYCLTR